MWVMIAIGTKSRVENKKQKAKKEKEKEKKPLLVFAVGSVQCGLTLLKL